MAPGDVYVTEEELEKIIESNDFSKYTDSQVMKLKDQWKEIQKKKLVKKILEREIAGVQQEVDAKFAQMKNEIEVTANNE